MYSEAYAVRVQRLILIAHLPVGGGFGILSLAPQWIAQLCPVRAYLMGASRVQPHFEQREVLLL